MNLIQEYINDASEEDLYKLIKSAQSKLTSDSLKLNKKVCDDIKKVGLDKLYYETMEVKCKCVLDVGVCYTSGDMEPTLFNYSHTTRDEMFKTSECDALLEKAKKVKKMMKEVMKRHGIDRILLLNLLNNDLRPNKFNPGAQEK